MYTVAMKEHQKDIICDNRYYIVSRITSYYIKEGLTRSNNFYDSGYISFSRVTHLNLSFSRVIAYLSRESARV